MGQETIPNLKKRIKAAETRRDARRSLNQSAYEIAMPQRNIYNNQSEGDSKMQGVFTSLGMSSVNNFVNNMQSSLTPPFTKWAEWKAGDDIPEENNHDLDEELQVLNKKIFSFLDASNFSTASSEMYYDLSVGTGALLLNKGTLQQPLNFQAVPTAQLALEEGVFGTIWGIFRKNKLVARLIQQTWLDAKIPDSLAGKIRNNPEQEIVLDEVTYYDPDTNKWCYEVLCLEGEISERLLTRVTIWNPWIVVRWSKIAGEVEGRGPLLQALPDLKMLNHGKEMAAISVQFNAFGSYTMEEEGIINTQGAEITPRGVLIVKNNPGGPHAPSIAALPRVGDAQQQEFFFESLEKDIKRIMLDNKLPDETGPVKSATEIVQRIKEFQVDFGSAFGRLMHEFITPLFKTIVQVLEAEQKITVPTIAFRDNLTGEIVKKKITDETAFTKIKMLAPIAKVQALEDIQNVMQAIQMLQAIEPRLPLLGYKVEELPDYLADQLGVPEKYVRSRTEQAQAMAGLAQLFGQQEAPAA